jgi:hypothetical protein
VQLDKRRFHRLPADCPVHQARPHVAYQDQWRVVNVFHLQELPDQHELKHGADAARRDYVG